MMTARVLGITEKPMGPTAGRGIGDVMSSGAPCPGSPGCPGNPIDLSAWSTYFGGPSNGADVYNLPSTSQTANPMWWNVGSINAPASGTASFWQQYGTSIEIGAIGLFLFMALTGRRR